MKKIGKLEKRVSIWLVSFFWGSRMSFGLADNVNMSVRDAIAREIVSNVLVHREFRSAFPAKLIIEKDRIYTENWSRTQWKGRIDLENFNPYPKNPIIANFFVNIGNADALGSGVRNLYKYTQIYSGGEPDFEENDVFKLTVPIANVETKIQDKKGLSERQNVILGMIRDENSIQVEDIAESFGLSRATILREIQEIKKSVVMVYDKKEKKWIVS